MEHKTAIKANIEACKKKLLSLQGNEPKNKEVSLQWFQNFCGCLTQLILLYAKFSSTVKKQNSFRNSVLLHITHLKEILLFLIDIFIREDENKTLLLEARNFAIKQLHWCLDGLLHDLNSNAESDGEESFVHWMDLALDKLLEFDFNGERESVFNVLNESRTIVEEVLSHAMSVAQIATEHYGAIKGSCQSVLEALESLESEIRKDDWNVAMCNLFVDVCNDKLCILERRINITVLKLCLNVFSDYKSSLERLHVFCLSDSEKTETDIDNLVAEFDLHVDRLMQIGFFAVACSTNTSRVTQIKNCLVSLEALEVELVPALTAVALERSKQSLQYADLMKSFWFKQAETLRNAVYFIIDPTAFSNVIYEELKSNLEDVENPASETKTAVLPFLAKTKILIDFIQVSSQDMIEDELNRVHPKLEKVKIAFNELTSATEVLLNGSNANRDAQKRILKRCKIALAMVKQLWMSCSEDKENSVKTANTEITTKTVGNPLIDHCIEKGKEILKDRSILKHSNSSNKVKTIPKGKKKETPLIKLIHQKRMNFTISRMNSQPGFNNTMTSILTDMSNMTKTLECSVLPRIK